MSDESEVIQDGLEADVPVVEAKEKPVFNPEAYQAKQEDAARKGGWKPFDEWVEGGGDPDQWRSAEAFNVRGEFIGKLKEKDREIDERLRGVNAIHQAQMKTMLADLNARRDRAIEDGSVKTVKALDKEINELMAVPPIPVPNVDPRLADPSLDEWNSKNQWVNEQTPKATLARALFQEKFAAGWSTKAILQHVNLEVGRAYPDSTSRATIADSEKPRSAGFRKSEKSVTMADLTPEEIKWRQALPGAWKDDASFLKAVADARKSQ